MSHDAGTKVGGRVIEIFKHALEEKKRGGGTVQRQPWQMTEAEWDAERESVRPNSVQSRFTKSSGSEATVKALRLEFLLSGVRDGDKARWNEASAGSIKLDRDEVEDIFERLNTPVRHSDIVIKALAEGLPVPAEVLACYSDLKQDQVCSWEQTDFTF